jgi:hypothetical protein
MNKDIVAMARAAVRDDRLSSGALYRELADEIERLRKIIRSCARGTEMVDLGNGEIIGLHLPNRSTPIDSKTKSPPYVAGS